MRCRYWVELVLARSLSCGCSGELGEVESAGDEGAVGFSASGHGDVDGCAIEGVVGVDE